MSDEMIPEIVGHSKKHMPMLFVNHSSKKIVGDFFRIQSAARRTNLRFASVGAAMNAAAFGTNEESGIIRNVTAIDKF